MLFFFIADNLMYLYPNYFLRFILLSLHKWVDYNVALQGKIKYLHIKLHLSCIFITVSCMLPAYVRTNNFYMQAVDQVSSLNVISSVGVGCEVPPHTNYCTQL